MTRSDRLKAPDKMQLREGEPMVSANSAAARQRPIGRRGPEQDATGPAPAGAVAAGKVVPADGAASAPAVDPRACAVTVIVVTFDSEEAIAACLAGLLDEYPVHVVDNASRDETLARIAAIDRPRLRVTQMARNEGFGRACNRALAEVSTAQALLLNPDAAISPAALARISSVMAATGDIAILAPRVLEAETASMPAPGASESRARAAVGPVGSGAGSGGVSQPAGAFGNGAGAALCEVPEVTGSCMLLDMAKLRQIGFFDENIFLYYEDSDLCRRARAAGFRVCIAADAVATHRSGDSSSAMRKGDLLRERLLGQSYAYFTANHDPRPRRRMARKALAHLSAGIGCLAAGRPARARMRFARMRGILDYLLRGRRSLWANRLAER